MATCEGNFGSGWFVCKGGLAAFPKGTHHHDG
jgi:hypothetical protein